MVYKVSQICYLVSKCTRGQDDKTNKGYVFQPLVGTLNSDKHKYGKNG